MILIDSSVLIEFFRKKDKTNTAFYSISKKYQNLYISSVSHYEIGIGNCRRHYEFWKEMSKIFIILPFDKKCSEQAIKIYSSLIKDNKVIDIADVFIGATALANSLPIATLNWKHFSRIKGLIIES